MNLLSRCLVMDIETATVGSKPNKEVDKLRYVGFKLPNGKNMVFHYSQKESIQNIISMYPVIIGHNIKDRMYKHFEMGYDVHIMERYGFNFFTKNHKRITFIDTQEIIEKRAKSMMGLDLVLGQFSLKYLSQYFNLKSKKGEFDYNLLQKESLKGEEYILMKEYLESDLNVTYQLFMYLYNFFSGFIEFCKPKDKVTFKWLTSSSGSLAYKIICFQAGLPEVYKKESVRARKQFKGGYVSLPERDYASGEIYCVDFSSLYPHMFIGGNLYSKYKPQEITGGLFPKENDYWDGGEIYGVGKNKIQGKYSRKQGKIESTLKKFYDLRVQIKKDMKKLGKKTDEYKYLNKKQYAIKILINTMYGISGSECFSSVYDLQTASDCTAMARTSIIYARGKLLEHGYDVIYSDTDSAYVVDVFKDKKRLESICRAISKKQINSFNIKIDSHDFEIENKKPFKKMWFFKNDKGRYNKKHYMIQTFDDEIKVKGLKIIKGDCSSLSKKVFKDYIIPHFKASEGDFYITPTKLLQWIKSVAESENKLLEKRYRVNDKSSYKSMSCIQAQISMRYGAGEHYLIDNKYIGAGKNKKKATLKELKRSFGEEWLKAVNLNEYLKELNAFVKPNQRKKYK